MLKKILLVVCVLAALSGLAQAAIVSEVDDFDKTKYIHSHFRLPGVEVKHFELKLLTFEKRITANNIEYILMFQNGTNPARNRFSLNNDFLVKFDNNDNEIYNLPRRGEAIILERFHEISFNVPKNIVDKILLNNKITIKNTSCA